jgi:molybdenum cofactor cytidylyltransferase
MLAQGSFGFGVALLAAGRSRRMGQPKMLLRWKDTSVLGHLLSLWQRLGAKQIGVVLAVDDINVAGELDRLGFPGGQRIFNPTPDRGMFSSIQIAGQWPGWKESLTHLLFVLGDQPHLREETLRELLDFAAVNPQAICQPCHAGHARHPVVLPKARFGQLATTSASNLNEFLRGFSAERAFLESKDPGLALDLDTMADYERARGLA